MTASVAEILVSEGLISNDQLAAAQSTAGAIGEPVLNVLVQQGAVTKKLEAYGRDILRVLGG